MVKSINLSEINDYLNRCEREQARASQPLNPVVNRVANQAAEFIPPPIHIDDHSIHISSGRVSHERSSREERQEDREHFYVVMGIIITILSALSLGLINNIIKKDTRKLDMAKQNLATSEAIEQLWLQHQDKPILQDLGILAQNQKHIDKVQYDNLTDNYMKNRNYMLCVVGSLIGGGTLFVGGMLSAYGLVVIGSIAIVASIAFACYNLTNHWNDEETAQERKDEQDVDGHSNNILYLLQNVKGEIQRPEFTQALVEINRPQEAAPNAGFYPSML